MGTTENAQPPEQQTVHLAGPEGTRLRFSGPPQRLSGAIPLINTGSEKQKVRAIRMDAEKLQGAARLPLREVPFSARLYGGEQASVPATIVLDPQTAPGTYEFRLTVGGRTLPATAHVSEVVDLRIDPGAITILAGSPGPHARTMVAENAGNVPLPTGAECEAPVFDSFDLIGSMLIGLSKADRKSAEALARGFLAEWANLHAGTLVTKRKPMTIQPGQKLSVDVEFHLPAELKPLRHYRAALQLYNATLAVDIYTSANYGGRPDDHKRGASRK